MYTKSNIQGYIYTQNRTYKDIYIHKIEHTRIYMYTKSNIQGYIYTQNRTYKDMYIHKIEHTRIYIYTKSNIQGYIYTKSQRPYIINDSSKVLDLATFYDRHTRGGGGSPVCSDLI
jgi:hypothetical protein